MKKNIPIIVAVVAAAIFGGIILLDKDTVAPTNSSAAPSTKTTNQTNNTSLDSTAGRYLNYSEPALSNATGTKILFFHAPWCPQCRALEESINIGVIPRNVNIYKVDYDSSGDLKKKYGVTLQTTLVKIDEEGNLVKKFVAYDNPTLDSVKSNLLE